MKSSYEKYYRCCLVFNRVLGKQRFVRSFISSHLFQTGDHMKTVVRVRVRRQLSFPSNSFRFFRSFAIFFEADFFQIPQLPPPPPPFSLPWAKDFLLLYFVYFLLLLENVSCADHRRCAHNFERHHVLYSGGARWTRPAWEPGEY